jgi:TPR repeat protein
LRWYRRGADQDDVDSQVARALAYADGLGVPQDFIEAHKWYNVAASRVKYADIRSDLIKRRDDMATKMTASQIADAQKLAREWKASPRASPAKPRSVGHQDGDDGLRKKWQPMTTCSALRGFGKDSTITVKRIA